MECTESVLIPTLSTSSQLVSVLLLEVSTLTIDQVAGIMDGDKTIMELSVCNRYDHHPPPWYILGVTERIWACPKSKKKFIVNHHNDQMVM